MRSIREGHIFNLHKKEGVMSRNILNLKWIQTKNNLRQPAYLTYVCFSFSTAAHGIFRHGHLPGFLCGRVARLPHSAHQDQTQATEEPGEWTETCWELRDLRVAQEHGCACLLHKTRPDPQHLSLFSSVNTLLSAADWFLSCVDKSLSVEAYVGCMNRD